MENRRAHNAASSSCYILVLIKSDNQLLNTTKINMENPRKSRISRYIDMKMCTSQNKDICEKSSSEHLKHIGHSCTQLAQSLKWNHLGDNKFFSSFCHAHLQSVHLVLVEALYKCPKNQPYGP